MSMREGQFVWTLATHAYSNSAGSTVSQSSMRRLDQVEAGDIRKVNMVSEVVLYCRLVRV